jgi:glycosyltransferase involved in cell wall biosynthesis
VKIHTVFITHNRLELTKQAISSYLATVDVPFSYMIVDNASTDGTAEWLEDHHHPALLLPTNRYPGYATNAGWDLAPSDATHLQRADNDFSFLPGWTREVRRRFMANPALGQLGLRTNEEELWVTHNTGGNCIVIRTVFAKVRWREEPWGHPKYPPGYSEDSFFSPDVTRAGWEWGRVKRPCITSLASGDWGDEYYQKSYGIRGITPNPLDPTAPGTR